MADLGQLCPSFESVSPTIKLNLDILKGAGSLTALKYQVIYAWRFPPLLVTIIEYNRCFQSPGKPQP